MNAIFLINAGDTNRANFLTPKHLHNIKCDRMKCIILAHWKYISIKFSTCHLNYITTNTLPWLLFCWHIVFSDNSFPTKHCFRDKIGVWNRIFTEYFFFEKLTLQMWSLKDILTLMEVLRTLTVSFHDFCRFLRNLSMTSSNSDLDLSLSSAAKTSNNEHYQSSFLYTVHKITLKMHKI